MFHGCQVTNMDRRKFLKLLAQSSASVGATVFVEKVWGFPIAFPKSDSRKLYVWGRGVSGFTGSDSTNVLSPRKILRSHKWEKLTIGNTGSAAVGFAQDTNGQIFGWGVPNNYQLGTTTGTFSSPGYFGSASTWMSVSTQNNHSVGLRPPGSLWSWGYNLNGQLGLSTAVQVSTPIQVGGVSNWVEAKAGFNATFAMNSAGEIWSIGNAANGYLGTGVSTGNFSSLIKIPSAIPWMRFAVGKTHCLGIKTDGTLWGWGQNGDGQLGIGNMISVSTPIQIGSLTNWEKIYAGFGISFAIRNDGTLWSWGYNGSGELGIGNTIGKSSMVQVGSLADWKELAPSLDFTLALKNDGTLWSWGGNLYGQLGIGNTTPQSSPVQIGKSLWSEISTQGTWAAAIRK